MREVNRTLRLVLLKEIPEDARLRQQWNAVVERLDQPQVFYTYEWSLAVQRAYHATLRRLLFLAYDENESLCGVAALAGDIGGKRASFLCATTGDYCDFLSPPELKDAFARGVLAELKNQGIEDITLTNLPADSDTVAAIERAAGTYGYRSFARTAYVCAQVSLGQLERRPGESKPVLPGKKMVRRSLSALGREAPVRVDLARSWDDLGPILSQFMQAHIARFLATGRISNLVQPERRGFLQELAKLLSESGWLVLSRLMVGETTVAWNYGFQFHGVLFWYQPTFESELEKLSPGFCLLAKLIEEAAENPALSIVDLGLGAEEYKERFANQSRETLYVTLRASAVDHTREILRYRAAQIVKASPRVEAAVRTAARSLTRSKDGGRREGFAGVLRVLAKRTAGFVKSHTVVWFLEWSDADVPHLSAAKLQGLDLNQLAAAAEQYSNDPLTLAYLLRAAARWRERNAEGFALIDPEGVFLSFAWVTAFEGFFLRDLNTKLEGPSPDSVILFECWTPIGVRGHEYHGQLIRLIAQRMRERGKKVWIPGTGSGVVSIRELEKAGFQKRYALVRHRFFGMQSVDGKTPIGEEELNAEVSARVS